MAINLQKEKQQVIVIDRNYLVLFFRNKPSKETVDYLKDKNIVKVGLQTKLFRSVTAPYTEASANEEIETMCRALRRNKGETFTYYLVPAESIFFKGLVEIGHNIKSIQAESRKGQIKLEESDNE